MKIKSIWFVTDFGDEIFLENKMSHPQSIKEWMAYVQQFRYLTEDRWVAIYYCATIVPHSTSPKAISRNGKFMLRVIFFRGHKQFHR